MVLHKTVDTQSAGEKKPFFDNRIMPRGEYKKGEIYWENGVPIAQSGVDVTVRTKAFFEPLNRFLKSHPLPEDPLDVLREGDKN